jgi:AcrR family transcriptional regulator
MARTTTITDKQILEAARAIFLEEGFGAQTAKIARRAQVSEGSIFKRFPTKEALFFAALEIDPTPAWHAEIDRRAGTGNCRDNLQAIFLSMLHFFNEMLPRTITALGSLGSMSARPFEGVEHPIFNDERKVQTFLRQEMELGRLHIGDAELLAQLILGSLTSYIFRAVITGQTLTEDNLAQLAAGTVDFIWSGIAPDQHRRRT